MQPIKTRKEICRSAESGNLCSPSSPSSDSVFDVAIVGGGPAGNQAALRLSQSGFSVVLLDHRTLGDTPSRRMPGSIHSALGDKLCTGIVSAVCLAKYNIPKDLIRYTARGATFYSSDSVQCEITKTDPQAFVIDRVAYVAGLARQAQAAGATYLLGRLVRDIRIEPTRVVIHAGGPHGTEQITSKLVILASGFGSNLARRVGLEPAGTPAYAAQAEISLPASATHSGVTVYVGRSIPKGFFGWTVPYGSALPSTSSSTSTQTNNPSVNLSNLRNLCTPFLLGVLGRGDAKDALTQLLQNISHPCPSVSICGTIRTWGVPLQPAKQTITDRVLLLGDIAGQVKPTTGGGIYYSLICADIAACVIAGALRKNDLSAASLARYDIEWRKKLEKELAIGYSARQFFERLETGHVESVVSIASRNGLLRDNVSFDWHGSIITRALAYRPLEPLIKPMLSLFGDTWIRSETPKELDPVH